MSLLTFCLFYLSTSDKGGLYYNINIHNEYIVGIIIILNRLLSDKLRKRFHFTIMYSFSDVLFFFFM